MRKLAEAARIQKSTTSLRCASVARKGGQITENCAEQIGGRMPGSGSVSLGKDGNGTEGEGRGGACVPRRQRSRRRKGGAARPDVAAERWRSERGSRSTGVGRLTPPGNGIDRSPLPPAWAFSPSLSLIPVLGLVPIFTKPKLWQVNILAYQN